MIEQSSQPSPIESQLTSILRLQTQIILDMWQSEYPPDSVLVFNGPGSTNATHFIVRREGAAICQHDFIQPDHGLVNRLVILTCHGLTN